MKDQSTNLKYDIIRQCNLSPKSEKAWNRFIGENSDSKNGVRTIFDEKNMPIVYKKRALAILLGEYKFEPTFSVSIWEYNSMNFSFIKEVFGKLDDELAEFAKKLILWNICYVEELKEKVDYDSRNDWSLNRFNNLLILYYSHYFSDSELLEFITLDNIVSDENEPYPGSLISFIQGVYSDPELRTGLKILVANKLHQMLQNKKLSKARMMNLFIGYSNVLQYFIPDNSQSRGRVKDAAKIFNQGLAVILNHALAKNVRVMERYHLPTALEFVSNPELRLSLSRNTLCCDDRYGDNKFTAEDVKEHINLFRSLANEFRSRDARFAQRIDELIKEARCQYKSDREKEKTKEVKKRLAFSHMQLNT